MKKTFLILLPIVVAVSLAFKSSIDPLPIGASLPNPDKKMKEVSGKEVSFKDVMNTKGLLVMFSCNTCPVVHAYQSRTVEVCNYARSKDIGVILLNSNEASRDDGDSFSDMKDYASEQRYTWPYVVDEKSVMANAFGANRTPECFLFNAEGKLVYHGAIDDNQNGPDEVTRKHLRIAIDEMLQGKDVAVKTTRSVGCTIKRLR
ncbi:MAG TPA: thioredoxin family protein [Chitinophagaceae bacterium]|jgi:thioredoxin-related protein|nr:thioredoxin family protein [Chitinophagaceae bacterium]